jgi:hypothetical protein
MHIIQPETVRRVIELAEAMESGPAGTGEASVSGADLDAFLSGVPHQEIVELVAMISVGRGDPGSDRFEFILGNIYMTKEKAVRYLLEKQHLAEYLKKAMVKLGMDE